MSLSRWWIATAIAFVALFPVHASAEPGNATVSVDRRDGFVWAVADVSHEGHVRVHIELHAPSEFGRRLWQRCRYPNAGTGRYRCGLDHAASHLRPGTWTAAVVVGGEVRGSTRFRIRPPRS